MTAVDPRGSRPGTKKPLRAFDDLAHHLRRRDHVLHSRSRNGIGTLTPYGCEVRSSIASRSRDSTGAGVIGVLIVRRPPAFETASISPGVQILGIPASCTGWRQPTSFVN